MRYAKLFIKFIVIITLVTNCSASTGTRYGEDDRPDRKKKNNREVVINEDFDITPFKTKIVVENRAGSSNINQDAWFDYEKFSDVNQGNRNRKIVGTVDGFRIVVLATDDIEEANQLRDKLYSQLKMHAVYTSFEPPFYKVKLGDFTNLAETNDLKFKLNQLGYTEARIVQETVNLFEE